MPKRIVFMAAVVSLIAAGCFVPSLHPLYTSDDVAFDPALVGTWVDDKNQETWVFSREGDHAYTLEHTDDHGRPGVFDVRLVELEGLRFLDIFPVRSDSGMNGIYEMHLLGVHSLVHLKQVEPVLQMALLDPDSVEALLERQPDAIRHDAVDGTMLLTASTEELRRFLPAHAAKEHVFGDYSALTKSQ